MTVTVAVARITNLKLASTGLEERVTSLVDGLETGNRVLSNIIQVWNVLGGMLWRPSFTRGFKDIRWIKCAAGNL